MVNVMEKKMKYLYIAIFLLMSNIAGAVELDIAGKYVYDVKVAKTEKELIKGLMFVSDLPENEGMIFDFRPYNYKKISMWMKNTYIPLDMLFINCDMKVVHIHKNAKPMSLDNIGTDEEFCYVLEINGGETDRKGIVVGDGVIIRK